MRTDADAFFYGEPHRPRHNVWVARMEAAGDIGAADDLEDRGVVARLLCSPGTVVSGGRRHSSVGVAATSSAGAVSSGARP